MSRRQRSPSPADDSPSPSDDSSSPADDPDSPRPRVNWDLYDPNVMRIVFRHREELEFSQCIENIVTTMKKVFRGFVLDAENEQKETIHETFNQNYQNDRQYRWMDLTDDELFDIGTIYGSYTIHLMIYVYIGGNLVDADLELVKPVIIKPVIIDLMDNIIRSSTYQFYFQW